MYHWQTVSYARHKATDELYQQVSDFIDHFVEYSSHRDRLSIPRQTIQLYNMSDDDAIPFLEQFSALLEQMKLSDKGLRARRDDLIGYIHQTLYLFHLA